MILDYLVDTLRGTWIYTAAKRARDLKRDTVTTVQHLKRQALRRSDGERFLLQRYHRVHGKPLNRTTPRTFTEKLYRRMLALNQQDDETTQQFTRLSDKFAARAVIETLVGVQHLVPLLWHGTDPRAIPFDTLPAEYVIKTNHASGQVIVVKGQAPRNTVSRLMEWLQYNLYWVEYERQYYHIPPRVLVEAYLHTPDGSGPLDYRFYCFHGVPVVIQVDNHAHDINPFFDLDWNLLDLYYREGVARPALAKPQNFARMLEIAAQLSAGIDFVRIDLYNIEGQIYCGEFTFTPTGGEMTLRPDRWDVTLGDKWV